jgi:hypothetical protein
MQQRIQYRRFLKVVFEFVCIVILIKQWEKTGQIRSLAKADPKAKTGFIKAGATNV